MDAENSPMMRMLKAIYERVTEPAGQMPGVPLTSTTPFFRLGEPVRVPVSPTSADDEFEFDIPEGATTFQFTNPNPFSVRLRGRLASKPFVAVTETTGWLWLPGTQGIRTSLQPLTLSAMSVDGPYASTNPDQVAGEGFVELQYGTGR